MTTAAEVCTRFELKPEAKAWLREDTRPREFMKALLTAKQFLSGIDFLAHMLPAREAVWWGCLCLQHASGGNFTDVEKTACRAAVEWVMRPEESVRAAAKIPAEAAGPASVAGALAMAVYQTGGNIAPPKAPPMSPPPYSWSKVVSRAVKLASTQAEPARIVETQEAFIYLGGRIAEERSWFGS
jgi:hypothetical protein